MFDVQGRIGEYDLVKVLARSHGTSGLVCLAVHAHTRHRVALKMIARRDGTDVEPLIAAEREGAMLQERLARRTDRVPRVYDCRDEDGVFYVAMEYVDGEDLDRRIGNGLLLPPEAAARIVADICECLACAHAAQHVIGGTRRAIVHGDVKPANIRVMPSGRARLLDFGTAKPVTSEQRSAFSTYLTLEYASPERIASGVIDAQTDLWAAGIVLYEAVAGRRPWASCERRTTDAARVRSVRTHSLRLPRACPEPLGQIIARALTDQLSERYETASAMRHDLDSFLFTQERSIRSQSQLHGA